MAFISAFFLSAFILVKCDCTEFPGSDEVVVGLSSSEILQTDWRIGSDDDENDDDDGTTMDESVLGRGEEALTSSEESSFILLQGDMKLDFEQYLRRFGNSSSAAFSGAAVTDPETWPRGIIPYTIDAALDGAPARMTLGAMKEWMERTCVRFEPAGSEAARAAGHNNAIKVIDGSGCVAGIGYAGKSYTVSLSKSSCTRHKSHLHELGHVIGLYHEQCRPDRDSAIKIVWDNISMMGSLQYVTEDGARNFGVPYDYCSIMHYGNKYFSANRRFTMLARDQDYQYTLGSAQHLSFNDAKIVNLMYDCNRKCDRALLARCSQPCYVNHRCECECDVNPCEKIPCEKRGSKRECDEAKRILQRG